MTLTVSVHAAISEIDRAQWNALAGGDPFLQYEFLSALETRQCLGRVNGWLPVHLAARNAAGELLGACPLYVKTNSYGEFVFDWGWEAAWRRAGLNYYPKLVCAIPYTPATGRRLLVAEGADAETVRAALVEQALALAQELKCSGVHWLFTADDETAWLEARGLPLRLGCQYHWRNRGYRDFEDFLDGFVSKKRKNLRQERRRVRDQGVELDVVHGHQADEALLATMHGFYVDTFEKHAGWATLTRDFFFEIAQTMGERLVLVVAKHGGRAVAGAINFRGDDTLYGRYWGCAADFHSLHFEACYYQGIDYCIREGLARYEPGAQGEHKISRGFLPTRTWSAHWIAEGGFVEPVKDFCQRERVAMQQRCDELHALSPFREDDRP
ncbi:MAG: GNAT family N-acetyltransferase [Chromatiales bacterium]|nr:GNAT family N-acetyltransferase [Chromatiales bacterium]